LLRWFQAGPPGAPELPATLREQRAAFAELWSACFGGIVAVLGLQPGLARRGFMRGASFVYIQDNGYPARE